MSRERMLSGVVVTLALVVGAPTEGRAADWGGISPGSSTIEAVRGQYGAPSQQSGEKLEGYDTTRWVYEGSKAPRGLKQLIIDFGLLTPAGYRADLVRDFKLVPNHHVFDRDTIIQGWGRPDRVGTEDGKTLFCYKVGLFVYLDDTGEDARSMYFTIPPPECPTDAR